MPSWEYLLLAGGLGLLVGVGLTLVGKNTAATSVLTRTVTTPAAVVDAAPRTVIRTRTVTAPATPITVTAPTAAPTTTAVSQQSFSGNGGERIGTIVAPTDSTVEWTNDGALFQVFDKDLAIGINSQASSGTSDLPAGTYSDVQINADGNWTFRVVAK